MSSNCNPARAAAAGFTLTEVAFSLLIAAVGVTSVMLILPMGATVQARARNQALASAIALELLDQAYNQPLPKWLRTPTAGFRTPVDPANPAGATDTAYPPNPNKPYVWVPFVPDLHMIGDRTKAQYGVDQVDVPAAMASPTRDAGYFTVRNHSILFPDPVVHAPDLETIVNTAYHGVFQVPVEIALRLDSDHDEIRRILDQGGSLYCVGPKGWLYDGPTRSHPRPVPDEVQNLVFAVVGFPQRNAEMFVLDGMFPGYWDHRAGFPKAVRLHPPTRTAMTDTASGPLKDANVPAAAALSEPAAPFGPSYAWDPAERCRQIVVWSVNWRSYQDAETSSLPPIDRYRFPVFSQRALAATATSLESAQAFKKIEQRASPVDNHDPQVFRPERWFQFGGVGRSATATNGTLAIARDSSLADMSIGPSLWQDMHWGPMRRGSDGADLNGNGLKDIGPTSPTVRLRAETILRLNFYDPRVWLTVNAALPPDA